MKTGDPKQNTPFKYLCASGQVKTIRWHYEYSSEKPNFPLVKVFQKLKLGCTARQTEKRVFLHPR